MRSSDLRRLQPFFTAVDGYVTALAHDTSPCRCELIPDDGRWGQPSGGCPLAVVYARPEDAPPGSCRTIVHTVLRFHLAQLRLPVDHITDPELDEAVTRLQALCADAPRLTAQAFADGVQAALHADRVNRDRS